MKKTTKRITYAIAEFGLLSMLTLLPFALVYIDAVVIGNGVGEFSVTEIMQAILLLFSILIFWHGAWRHPDCRGFLMLVAGFFSCALIRELDSVFDVIRHGFWLWPALLVALLTIYFVVVYYRSTVAGPMSDFIGTRSYFCIMAGLIVVLVFSRTFGSGNLLWKNVLGVEYTPKFIRALQEGSELFGYLYIAYGSFVFKCKRFSP